MANYESNKFINKKNYSIDTKEGTRLTNFCLYPKEIYEREQDMELSAILYKAYYNLVFDLTYLKIKNGKWWWIKKIKIREIIKKIIYFYLGISKLMFKLIASAIKIKKKNYDDIETAAYFLFIRHPILNNMIIVKLNGKWILNGPFKHMEEMLKKIIKTNVNKYNENHYDKWLEITETNLYKMIEATKEAPRFSGKHINPNLLIEHKTWLDVNSKDKMVAYETDLDKAKKKDFYGKEKMIEKIGNKEKETTLIQEKAQNIRITEDPKLTSTNKLIEGIIGSPNNKELIDTKLIQTSEEVLELIKDTENKLREAGMAEIDIELIKQTIVSLEYSNSITDDSIEKFF